MSIAGVSTTDLEIFRTLANPNKVELKVGAAADHSNHKHNPFRAPPTTIHGLGSETSHHTSANRPNPFRPSPPRSTYQSHHDQPPSNNNNPWPNTTTTATSSSSAYDQETQKYLHAHHSPVLPPPTTSSYSRPPNVSPLRTRSHKHRSHKHRHRHHRHSPTPMIKPYFADHNRQQSPFRPTPFHRSSPTQTPSQPPPAPTPARSQSPIPSYAHHRSPHRSPHRSSHRSSHRPHHSHNSHHPRNTRMAQEENRDENVRAEKRSWLMWISKMKEQNPNLQFTENYTMDHLLSDIRDECEGHQSNYEIIDTVAYFKDFLKMAFLIIDGVNTWLGSFLQLQGWSQYMINHIHRFDRVLERYYHRYWRQGQPSIWMEFMLMIFGSMFIFHMQNRYCNGMMVGEWFGVMPGAQNNATGNTSTPTRGPDYIPGANKQQQQQPGMWNIMSQWFAGSGSNVSTSSSSQNSQTTPNSPNDQSQSQTQTSGGLMQSLLRLFGGVGGVGGGGGGGNAGSAGGVGGGNGSGIGSNGSGIGGNVSNLKSDQMTTNSNQQTFTQPLNNQHPPVPATTTVANLPTMNINGVTNRMPTRRVLRRPSSYLTEPSNASSTIPVPLRPVSERYLSQNIPNAPGE